MKRIKYLGTIVVFLPAVVTAVWMPGLILAWLAGMLAVFIREVDSASLRPARTTRIS